MHVQSLALLSRLRIQWCCELRCRSWLGSHIAVAVASAGSWSSDSAPSLGTCTCCRCGPKKNKQKNTTSAFPLQIPFNSHRQSFPVTKPTWPVLEIKLKHTHTQTHTHTLTNTTYAKKSTVLQRIFGTDKLEETSSFHVIPSWQLSPCGPQWHRHISSCF